MSDRIKVGVKLRPLIGREKQDKCEIHWQALSDTAIAQVDPNTGKPKGEHHVFDRVFGPDSSNREVFEVLVKPIVEAAVRGFNGTIFAYGQTASGKTYTMMGDRYEQGIIPQAVNLIFDMIDNSHGRQFLLRVCYMEIYNEKINDLLLKENKNMKISEDPQGNVVVKGLTETITNSSQMVMDLMKKGEAIRKIGETNMNERSSRSHSIFRMIIESRSVGDDNDEAIQVSHLNLVDLAGSERAGQTGAVGDQFKEGCAINKSLFTLGKVIAELSDGNVAFVNFRDSKLTRILQSSLGGNALTSIVCAITPAAIEETSSTLGFASRARNIKNTATVNEVLSDAALLKRYMRQMDKLKSELNTLEEQKSAENLHLQKQNLLLLERITRLKDALLVSSSDPLEQSNKSSERLKKLRRRTWSAPNHNPSRLSLALPSSRTESLSHLEGVREESSRLSFLSVKSKDDVNNDSVLFSTPLEEFEEDLIKAERAKSFDVDDWLPQMDASDDDAFRKSLDEDVGNHPTISYVQTRKPQKTHLSKVNAVNELELLAETPPPKLRAKIKHVEKELDEISEFTRLEKQMFNAELNAELERVKNELRESQAQCESLQGIQDELEKLGSSDRSLYDSQMLLLDSNKQVAKLTDENREIKNQLSIALSKCEDLDELKNEHGRVLRQLADYQHEITSMKERIRGQQDLIQQLENVQEDFDMKLEMTVSKYEMRQKDLIQALEDARREQSNIHPPPKTKYFGNLYSLEEEPSIDDLVQQVQCLKDENKDLQHQLNNLTSCKNTEVEILESELSKKNQLLESLQTALQEAQSVGNTKSSIDSVVSEQSPTVTNIDSTNSALTTDEKSLDELSILKALVEEKTRDLEEYKKLSADKIEELYADVVDLKKTNMDLLAAIQHNEYGGSMEIHNETANSSVSNVLNMSQDQLTSNSRLINELAAKQENIMELERQIVILSQYGGTINASPTKLQSQVNESEYELKLASLRDQIKDLETEKNTLKEKLTEKLDMQIQIELLQSANKSLIEKLNNSQNEVELLTEAKKSLVQQLKSKEVLRTEENESVSMQDFQVISSDKDVKFTCEKCVDYRKELDAVQLVLCGEGLKLNDTALATSITQLLTSLRNEKKTFNGTLLPPRDLACKCQSVDFSDEFLNCKNDLELAKSTNGNLIKDLKHKEDILAKRATELEQLREKIKDLELASKNLDKTSEIFDLQNGEEAKIEFHQEIDAEEELKSARRMLSAVIVDEATDDLPLDTLLSKLLSSLNDMKTKVVELEEKIVSLKHTLELKELQEKLEESTPVSKEAEALEDSSSHNFSGRLTELERELQSCKIILSSAMGLDKSTDDLPMMTLVSKIISFYTDAKEKCAELQEGIVSSQCFMESERRTFQELNSEMVQQNKNHIQSLMEENKNLKLEVEHKNSIIHSADKEHELLIEKVLNLENILEKKSLMNGSHLSEEGSLCPKCIELEEELMSAQQMLAASIDGDENVASMPLSSLITCFLSSLTNANRKCAELEEAIQTSKCAFETQDDMDSGSEDPDKLSYLQNELKLVKNENHELIKALECKQNILFEADLEANELRRRLLEIESASENHPKDELSSRTEVDFVCKKCVEQESELVAAREMLSSAIDGENSADNKSLTSMVSCFLSSLTNSNGKDRSKSASEVQAAQINSDELAQRQNELLSLRNENNILIAELESKPRIINETDNVVEILKQKNQLLEDNVDKLAENEENSICNKCVELECKLESALSMCSDQGLESFENDKSSPLISKFLSTFKEVNEHCSKLKQNICDGMRLRESSDEEICVLQKRCSELEIDIKSAKSILSSELRAITLNNVDEDVPLPSLISEFLSSVMKVQEHVASVMQTQIDDCKMELESYMARENEHLAVREKQQDEVKDLKEKNDHLKKIVEDLQIQEQDLHGSLEDLQQALEKLSDLVNITNAKLSPKDLFVIFENKIRDLNEKTEEVALLQSNIKELQFENENLLSKLTSVEERVSKENESIKLLQEDDFKAREALRIEQKNLQKLREQMLEGEAIMHDLRAELEHNVEIKEKLEGDLRNLRVELNQKVESAEKLEEDLNNLRVELSQKVESAGKLEEDLNNLRQKLKTQSEQLEKISSLEIDKKNLESICADLKSALKTAEEEVNEGRKTISDLRDQLLKNDDEVQGIYKTIQEKDSKINSLEDRISNLENTLHEVEGQHASQTLSEVQSLKTENSKLQSQLTHKNALFKQSQSRAACLHNDVTEMKEIISKLEKEGLDYKLIIKQKEDQITSILQSLDELQLDKKALEAELPRVRMEKDQACEKLATVLNLPVTDEVKELKAEVEFLKQQYDDVVKSSRDLRLRNKKLHAESNKLKEKLDESKKFTAGIDLERQLSEEHLRRQQLQTQVDDLEGRLSEEITKGQQLQAQLDDQLNKLCQLERSKTNRTFDYKRKREAARHSKGETVVLTEDIQDLQEKFEKANTELQSKTEDVLELKKKIDEKEELLIKAGVELQKCQSQLKELEEEKTHLNNECEELLSWGRSFEKNNSQLADQIADLLKQLVETKTNLFSSLSGRILLLTSASKQVLCFCDKVIAEQIEMQFSSKEKATRNAKARVENLQRQIDNIKSQKVINFDHLQELCDEINKEIDIISTLDEEALDVWKRMEGERKSSENGNIRECHGCSDILEWGKENEAKLIEKGNLVSHLQEELKKLQDSVNIRTTRRRAELLSEHNALKAESNSNAPVCECVTLKEMVQKQRTELADKNARIAHLKMIQQVQNKPAEDTIKRLQEKLRQAKEENAALRSDHRRILKSCQEPTLCESTRKKDMQTQTTENSNEIYKSRYWSGGPSGIVDESNRAILESKCRKLEQEKKMYKELCIKRKDKIDSLEKQLNQFMKENDENNEPNKYFTRSRRGN